MSTYTIYHNPRCSKSRQTLQLLEENGIIPEIKLYLDKPPNKQELSALINLLGITTRDLLRSSEEAYKNLNLKDNNISDDKLLQAMVEHPKLIQRPIVVKDNKAVLGRPPENIMSLL